MNICKKCGATLVIQKTKAKPSRLTQPYYFTSFYKCPVCGRMYHDEKFKVVNENFSLFTNRDVLSDVACDIWTDGACSNNGNHLAKAAWAFVSGKHEEAGLVEGKQTNNIAEALAIYHALLWAASKGHKQIRIHSDSQITINNLQKPLSQIKANQEIFRKIFHLVDKEELTVHYQKVLGHSGDENNERADALAFGLVETKLAS